jgi:UDPglucose 6-dehydrogenase
MTPQILNSVINVNKEQRLKIVKKVQDELKIVKGKTISVLGIAFKPDTDDTREAPSISIMNSLVNLGAKIKAYDPIVKSRPAALSEKVEMVEDMYSAIDNSDLVILATEWNEFKKLDFIKVKSMMSHNIFIDGRNMFDKKALEDIGFRYIGIGR